VKITAVRDYLRDLQDSIVSTLQKLDGGRFTRDEWKRPGGGGGVSRILEGGKLFERAGVGFSHVSGTKLHRRRARIAPGLPDVPGVRWACRSCCTH
jgi:coproporphyrinogen III oxidase